MSQPSLPLGVTAKAKRALYLSDEDLGQVQARMEAEPDLCVLGLRFSHDRFVPRERFEHLRQALGDRFVAVEIDSSKGNPHGNPAMAHSVDRGVKREVTLTAQFNMKLKAHVRLDYRWSGGLSVKIKKLVRARAGHTLSATAQAWGEATSTSSLKIKDTLPATK